MQSGSHDVKHYITDHESADSGMELRMDSSRPLGEICAVLWRVHYPGADASIVPKMSNDEWSQVTEFANDIRRCVCNRTSQFQNYVMSFAIYRAAAVSQSAILL